MNKKTSPRNSTDPSGHPLLSDSFSERLKSRIHGGTVTLTAFLRWLIAAIVCGLAGGVIGAAFHHSIRLATQYRTTHTWMICLLPLGGILTVLMYKLAKTPLSVNTVLVSVRSDREVPPLMAPLIFAGTVITQFFGGSAGKEGAALQMGGTLGFQLAKLFHLDEKDSHILVMCGMSAIFSAVFGTPLAAAIFSIEVISVGIFYFAALVPCLFASLAAVMTAGLLHVEYAVMPEFSIPAFSFGSVSLCMLLGLVCAIVGVLFCIVMHYARFAAFRLFRNELLRALIVGLVLLGLTLVSGTRDYNGTGIDLVTRAVGGDAATFAFLLKILFTAITLASGMRGGEIVPTMAIGATAGCVFGQLTGLGGGFCAALALCGLFCAMVNCPVTSLLLGIELFGSGAIVYIAIVCAISFALSGNYSLYSEQKMMYSKIRAAFTNVNTHG